MMKEVVKGIGLALMAWMVVLGVHLLANNGSLAALPSLLAMLVRFAMMVVFVAGVLYGLYRTFVRPFIYVFKVWRRGEKGQAIVFIVLYAATMIMLYNLLHWSRMPEYDSVSPDGKYKAVVYMTNFDINYLLPGGPGDARCHEARIDLVEVATGKIIDSGRLGWLMNVDIQWYGNEMFCTTGDGPVFRIPD